MTYSLSFDEQSLKEIAKLAGVGTLLQPEVQKAMTDIGTLIITKTHDNALARFATNSPGGLAESFTILPITPFELQVGSDKPYAHRMDEGFGIGGTEATDSLGRVYHYPGTLYFTDAVTEVESGGEGVGLLQDAVMTVIGGL